ncbi:DUF4142 domain-containing protein [Sphingomonas sp.]|jgi:putative membrane protein|uniref:DUF4142 domain-containing protein n=1 Tax=Sphingomonas sp. TaxID=28214 RepID=UPI002ED97C99
MKLAITTALIFAGAAPAAAQVMPPAQYVKNAGASDLYEITSSRTVLESTADPKVRSFAQMMIAHHTKSTAAVKAAATRARVRAPKPMLNPVQAELVAQLRAETGTARDTTYIAQQRQAHGQALALQQAYASEGKAAPLKAAATKIVPVVKSHIAMLKTM